MLSIEARPRCLSLDSKNWCASDDDFGTRVDVENPYSGILTATLEMLEDHGRLYRQSTEMELGECGEHIP